MSNHPDPEQLRSDRFGTFMAAGAVSEKAGPIETDAASFGTPDEWAWSAISYLKGALNGTRGGALGGEVEVSAAAIGTLLTYVERLEMGAGIIPTPGGAA